MKSKVLNLGALALTASVLAACHHHDDNNGGNNTNPPPPAGMSIDSAQALVLAQQTSETSSPFAVNGGALVLNDTSETSSPIAVDAM